MFEQMFLNALKSDFKKGLSKLAKEHNTTLENIQVQIGLTENLGLKYNCCVDWKIVQPDMTFKQVMGLMLDVMNKEAMVSPIIAQMLLAEISKCGCDSRNVTAFLFFRHDEICVAMHNGKQYTGSPKKLADMFEGEPQE